MEIKRELIDQNGRSLVTNFCILVRMTGMYDSMNDAVLNAARRFTDSLYAITGESGEITLKVSDGIFYIEGVRIRSNVSDMENFNYLSGELTKKSIGVLRFVSPIQTDDLVYLAYAIKGGAEASEVQTALESKLKKGISVGGPVIFAATGDIDTKDTMEVARHAYLRTLSAFMSSDSAIKAGRAVNMKKVKKALQSIIDCLQTDDKYLLGFTTIRDVANYYYHHPVNVVILSVALGKRAELNRVMLSKLAFAAFFHDIGKAALPLDFLNKDTDFTMSELELIKMHPRDGVKEIVKSIGLNEFSMIAMIVAYEHHRMLNHSGYPEGGTNKRLNVFSRIVSIADDFDSQVSGKVISRSVLSTEDILKEMYGKRGVLYDAHLLKNFIGMFR